MRPYWDYSLARIRHNRWVASFVFDIPPPPAILAPDTPVYAGAIRGLAPDTPVYPPTGSGGANRGLAPDSPIRGLAPNARPSTDPSCRGPMIPALEEAMRLRDRLWNPNVVVFLSSACIMVIELVASRLIAPRLGVSLYTWTAVIGVILAGISLGN